MRGRKEEQARKREAATSARPAAAQPILYVCSIGFTNIAKCLVSRLARCATLARSRSDTMRPLAMCPAFPASSFCLPLTLGPFFPLPCGARFLSCTLYLSSNRPGLLRFVSLFFPRLMLPVGVCLSVCCFYIFFSRARASHAR